MFSKNSNLWRYNVYANIRGGSQDLCKLFSNVRNYVCLCPYIQIQYAVLVVKITFVNSCQSTELFLELDRWTSLTDTHSLVLCSSTRSTAAVRWLTVFPVIIWKDYSRVLDNSQRCILITSLHFSVIFTMASGPTALPVPLCVLKYRCLNGTASTSDHPSNSRRRGSPASPLIGYDDIHCPARTAVNPERLIISAATSSMCKSTHIRCLTLYRSASGDSWRQWHDIPVNRPNFFEQRVDIPVGIVCRNITVSDVFITPTATWRHRSRDHSTRNIRFAIGGHSPSKVMV